MTIQALIVGGPHDGERREVERRDTIELAVKLDLPTGPMPWSEALSQAVTTRAIYKHRPLRNRDHEWHIYAPPEMDDRAVFDRLLAGYAPSPSR